MNMDKTYLTDFFTIEQGNGQIEIKLIGLSLSILRKYF